MFGFLNINKPVGKTSHDVVNNLRRILNIKKIGHAGTLDPMASGVLPIAVSNATKLIDFLPEEKEYIAKFQLGVVSDSYDTECELKYFSDKKVEDIQIKSVLEFFKGEILQKPPIYSAVKKNGKKLYELARKGCLDVEIPERLITVSKIKLLNFDEAARSGELLIACSKGTYIRSIIHDLGQNLETGAVMTALLRSKSGGMSIDNALDLEQIINADFVMRNLINPAEIIDFNKIFIDFNELEKVKHGMSFYKEVKDGLVFLIFEDEIVAFAEVCNNNVKIKKVFIS